MQGRNENIQAQQSPSIKRKREIRSSIIGVATSMSQMSLSNLLPSKRQRSTAMNDIIEEKDAHQSKSMYQPKYLQVPDQIFKQMLSKSLTGAESIVQSLNTSEKLQYVRTYAHRLNHIFYLKLEQDFWQSYAQILTTEDIGSLSPFEQEIIKKNNLYRLKFKSQSQLEKHRKSILDRLQKAEVDFNQHKLQPCARLIDMQRLSTVIPAFVRQGQHRLSNDFDRRKRILQCDAHDHRLIKTFYNLKPNENQVTLGYKLVIRQYAY